MWDYISPLLMKFWALKLDNLRIEGTVSIMCWDKMWESVGMKNKTSNWARPSGLIGVCALPLCTTTLIGVLADSYGTKIPLRKS